jgi:hypothetical protein
MQRVPAVGTLVFAMVAVAPNASAQTMAPDEWRRGTTLAGFVGAASASSNADVGAGAAIGWEIAPHFTLEGRGVWLDSGDAANAFAALLGARIPLLTARPVVPVLSGSVGVYRATFNASTGMPPFYRSRMTPDASGFNGRTFNDFVMGLGGGVDISVARHLALRPDVTVLLVTTRSEIRAVPVYGVQLAYHFEDRPITPVGRVGAARSAR